MADNSLNKIKNIPLSMIKPNPEQPRKYFDPDAMDALTDSIERYGILSPITVRESGDDSYELISGERRYRAAYAAGLSELPCIITEASRSECAILSLLENLQREDLSFLEVAESYRGLVKNDGYTSRELSRHVGDRPHEIKDRISLMRLDPIVRKYIRSFHLSERQAAALLRIRDRDRQIDAARQICENGLSEKESLRYISQLVSSNIEPSIQINRIRDIKLLRNTLTGAISLVRKSGIEAEFNESDCEQGHKFVIIIKN